MIQGYIEIDYQAMTDDEFDQFNAFMLQFTLHYYKCSKVNNREYYYCIMVNDSLLSSLLLLMENRNPIVNGMWQQDGTPYGQVKTVTYDTGTEEEIVEITGDPEFTFDLNIHLVHTPTDKTYDEEGSIISEVPVTEFRPLHGFAGWTLCNVY